MSMETACIGIMYPSGIRDYLYSILQVPAKPRYSPGSGQRILLNEHYKSIRGLAYEIGTAQNHYSYLFRQ